MSTIGKFTAKGVLAIKRGRNFVEQTCINPKLNRKLCAGDCPLLGEPEYAGSAEYQGEYNIEYNLRMCKRTLHFVGFTDERL